MRPSNTRLRMDILKAVQKSKKPLSAYDLKKKFGERTNLSTIYRALKFLEGRNWVESITIQCCSSENTRFYFSSLNRHVHFIHCEQCHRFTPFRECFITDQSESIGKKYGHTIRHHVLFFYGLCDSCRKKTARGKTPKARQ